MLEVWEIFYSDLLLLLEPETRNFKSNPVLNSLKNFEVFIPTQYSDYNLRRNINGLETILNEV